MENITNQPHNKKPKGILRKSVIFGLLVIFFGVALLLNNLDLLDKTAKEIIFSWKTLLIAIGIINLFSREFFSGLILIIIGTFFHITHYYEIPVTFVNVFWPILIISFGLIIIIKHFRTPKRNFMKSKYSEETSDFYEEATVFGGSHKFIKNDSFKGARISAVFGGSKINLQQSILSPEGAVLDVNLIFGGCELIVPPDWNIRLEANNIFGGINDKRSPSNIDTSKNLVIKGMCIFGGCEIKSY
jgi:predicted membrane protein